MVVEANVGLERRLELSECGEGPASDPLGLQGVEERLYVGIVLVAARSVHAGSDPVPPEDRPVAVRPILNPAIGVKDERPRRCSVSDRSLHGQRGEIHRAVRTERPAHDAARADIHDGGQETGPPLGLEVGDVTHPLLVDPRGWSAGHAQVVGGLKEAMHARGPAGHPHHPSLQSRRAHEPRHPILARSDAFFAQGPHDPGAAVGAMGAPVDALDVLQQRVVGLRSRAGGTPSPGIVAALREPVMLAEELDPVLTAVPAYEREDLALRSKLNWIAFFRSSFSILAFFKAASSSRMRWCSETAASMP